MFCRRGAPSAHGAAPEALAAHFVDISLPGSVVLLGLNVYGCVYMYVCIQENSRRVGERCVCVCVCVCICACVRVCVCVPAQSLLSSRRPAAPLCSQTCPRVRAVTHPPRARTTSPPPGKHSPTCGLWRCARSCGGAGGRGGECTPEPAAQCGCSVLVHHPPPLEAALERLLPLLLSPVAHCGGVDCGFGSWSCVPQTARPTLAGEEGGESLQHRSPGRCGARRAAPGSFCAPALPCRSALWSPAARCPFRRDAAGGRAQAWSSGCAAGI